MGSELPSEVGQIGKKQDQPPALRRRTASRWAAGRGAAQTGWWGQSPPGPRWEQGWDWQGRVFLPLLGCMLRETVTDREAWRAAVHGVTKSRTRLSH